LVGHVGTPRLKGHFCRHALFRASTSLTEGMKEDVDGTGTRACPSSSL
jgi:hypothetical protein